MMVVIDHLGIVAPRVHRQQQVVIPQPSVIMKKIHFLVHHHSLQAIHRQIELYLQKQSRQPQQAIYQVVPVPMNDVRHGVQLKYQFGLVLRKRGLPLQHHRVINIYVITVAKALNHQ